MTPSPFENIMRVDILYPRLLGIFRVDESQNFVRQFREV